MYLELLDEKTNKKGQKTTTTTKKLIMSKKYKKKDGENVRSTWLDRMASEGIQ